MLPLFLFLYTTPATMTNTASTARATSAPTTAPAATPVTGKEVESSVGLGNIVIVMDMTDVVVVSDLDAATAENIFMPVFTMLRCECKITTIHMLDSMLTVQIKTYLLPLRSKEHEI